MKAMLMLLQSPDVHIEGALPLWELISGVIMAASIIGGMLWRLIIFSGFHDLHFKHEDDRALHPDPRIAEEQQKALVQSQLHLNDILGRHLESDMRVAEKQDRNVEDLRHSIDEFRKAHQEQSEKMMQLLIEFKGR